MRSLPFGFAQGRLARDDKEFLLLREKVRMRVWCRRDANYQHLKNS
jgi:hypothetical protein